MADRIDSFKVAPPGVAGAVDRPRLVGELRGIGAPAKWLAAPSGSGKSVLAAQYAAATGKRLCWYRLDRRDDDPAFFYPRWSAAWQAAMGTRRRGPLPRVSAEDSADESAFATRFFAMPASATPPTLFVFDDVHEVTANARLRALAGLAAALSEAHEILFVGQDAPPPEFFDLISSRRLALCNDLTLAFDDGESAALAQRLRLKTSRAGELGAMTGGHAAALVLACEFLRNTQAGNRDQQVERIHAHLLDRLLERIAPERRRLLLRTAFAPRFDAALASALAGDDAASALDGLVRQGLLRRQAGARGDEYEAHALVRQGARASLRSREGDAATHALALTTADLLEAHGQPDAAFELLLEFDAHERAAQLLEALAERYARGGEAALASRAASMLADAVLDRHPWLCFWIGRALQGIDEERARGWFERSHTGFHAAGDASGMRIAAASVVTAFVIEYGDIRTLESWVRRHAEAGGEQPVPRGSAHEATLCLGVVCAALNAGAYPATIDADALVRRLQQLLDEESAWLNRDHAVEAARLLVDHARLFGSREQAQAMVLATRRFSDDDAAQALKRGRWHLSAAHAYLADGKRDIAERYLQLALKLAEQSGSRTLTFECACTVVNVAHSRGDLDAAVTELQRVEGIVSAAPPAQRAEHARLTARVLLAQRRHAEGLRWAQQALELAREAGYSGASTREFDLECVNGLAANGRVAEAAMLARTVASRLQGAEFVFHDAIGYCLEFLAGNPGDPELLRKGLAQAEASGFVYMLARAGDALPRLCDAALRHDTHRAFVHRLIRTNRVAPPRDAHPGWPWPVRVRTLGGFALTLRDEPYRPSRKAQDKPLELLKLLVCCQAMRRASTDKNWIAQRLWPDADEANARKSLDMAVSRLRRLLGDDDTVVSQESRLGLSATAVWTDIGPLLDALARVNELRDRHAAGKEISPDQLSATLAGVVDHYAGPFLPEDEGPAWLLAGREAVASAVRSTLLLAEPLFATARDGVLERALARAFDADPTSEDLARALMRSALRAGQHAEVLRVYRRLRNMLSIVLGVSPSRDTERLKEQAYAEANAGAASAASR